MELLQVLLSALERCPVPASKRVMRRWSARQAVVRHLLQPWWLSSLEEKQRVALATYAVLELSCSGEWLRVLDEVLVNLTGPGRGGTTWWAILPGHGNWGVKSEFLLLISSVQCCGVILRLQACGAGYPSALVIKSVCRMIALNHARLVREELIRSLMDWIEVLLYRGLVWGWGTLVIRIHRQNLAGGVLLN